MPYICLARTDIPDGQVQILDLLPNTSQRSLIYDPPGQTKYINRAVVEIPQALPSGQTRRDYNGLAAYVLDRVEPAGITHVTVSGDEAMLAVWTRGSVGVSVVAGLTRVQSATS